MVDENNCVALYRTQEQVEAAVRLLQNAAFDIKKISIISMDDDYDERPVGSVVFWIAGLGTVVIAGPLVAVLVAALEGAVVVVGLSALGVAFDTIGIPKESIIGYEMALKSLHHLIIVQGSQQEVERAYEVLAVSEPLDATIHLS